MYEGESPNQMNRFNNLSKDAKVEYLLSLSNLLLHFIIMLRRYTNGM